MLQTGRRLTELTGSGGSMGHAPFLSVVICTRDRAASLERTLESLVAAAQRMARPWELVVVDNGSSDETPQVIASFADRLPVRGVREDAAGLSNARNAGVKQAQGEYIVWTDDDVVVDPGWLEGWAGGIEQAQDCAVFGGRALPVFEEPVQDWFVSNERHLQSLLAVRDSREWTEVDVNHVPFGLNFAVRAVEQRAHPYDPELGVGPGRRLGGEEVAVIRAILREGGRGRWVWDALVRHMIPASRQSAAYIRRFYKAIGYGYPIGGKRQAAPLRAWGALLAGVVWATSRLRLGRFDESGEPADVRALVRLGLAEGSLRQHLGRPLDD